MGRGGSDLDWRSVQAVVDRYAEKAKEKHVDGSPI